MKTNAFLLFMLILFSGLLAVRTELSREMSPVDRLQKQIAQVSLEKRQALFRAEIAANQLSDFKEQVATILPQALQSKDDIQQVLPLRGLASVVVAPEPLLIERASGLLEKGKKAFREGKYEDADMIFEDLIQKYPDSSHVAEAHFLLAEGQYQSKDYEHSLATIERMIDLFPESPLTGYSLLRLARIFESKDRLEDASDIYRAIVHNFTDPDLVNQARANLKAEAM